MWHIMIRGQVHSTGYTLQEALAYLNNAELRPYLSIAYDKRRS